MVSHIPLERIMLETGLTVRAYYFVDPSSITPKIHLGAPSQEDTPLRITSPPFPPT